MKTIHKILITLGLVLLCFAGCESDLTGVKEVSRDNLTGISVVVNYNNNGRAYNLNCIADSLIFTGSDLLIYSNRTYQIHKDSLINYTVK